MSSRLLALSDGFYQVLLQLYPRSFRKRFAVEMSQVFRALCREAYAESGAGGVLRLWLPILWDWAWSALYQWWLRISRRSGETMGTNLFDRRDGVSPLSAAQAGLAALPFLAFGISSMASRLEFFHTTPASLPLWQILLIHPYLVFNWLILIGLGAGLLAGFPRWAYSFLGWALLFGWWWSKWEFLRSRLGLANLAAIGRSVPYCTPDPPLLAAAAGAFQRDMAGMDPALPGNLYLLWVRIHAL